MLLGTEGSIENQLGDWIRQRVCTVDDEHGFCKKVVVRHLNIDKKPVSDVASITVSTDPALEGSQSVDMIVSQIAHSAIEDANDLSAGVQTYAAYAYYTKDTNYVPRKIFRVAAEEEMDRSAGPTEPPTEKGLTSQLMRHLEVVSKNALVGMGYIMQTFQKEIEQQRNMNAKFMSQQIEMSVLVQEILNDGHKRHIDDKESEMKVSMMEGAFEHLKIVLPILANRLAGKDVFPPKMDREMYMLATLLENLSPEQQNMLQSMLKPEQMTVLAELLGMYEKRKEKLGGGGGGEGDAKDAGSKQLLKLFESRENLIRSDKALEVDDVRSKRIEAKAAKIRATLEEIGNDISKSAEGPKKR
jgi:hypothetical protein